jgi:hypothetical protein
MPAVTFSEGLCPVPFAVEDGVSFSKTKPSDQLALPSSVIAFTRRAKQKLLGLRELQSGTGLVEDLGPLELLFDLLQAIGAVLGNQVGKGIGGHCILSPVFD